MKQSGKSIRNRLYNIAGTQGVNYQHLLIRFFHERLLYRVSISSYRNNFYLKGGALLYAFNTDEKQRYTLDIDFSLYQMKYKLETVALAMQEICEITANDAVQFHSQSMETHYIRENNIYGGIRMSIDASLDTIRQRLQIDVGYGDPVNTDLDLIRFPVLLKEFSQPAIRVYSVEFVIAEKFHAMIELSELNSRMKDFYDVYQLLLSGKIDMCLLQKAVRNTFNHRQTVFVANHTLFTPAFASDNNRNRMWSAFLKKIGQPDKLSFSEVMTLITTCMQPIWESLPKEKK